MSNPLLQVHQCWNIFKLLRSGKYLVLECFSELKYTLLHDCKCHAAVLRQNLRHGIKPFIYSPRPIASREIFFKITTSAY